MNESLVLGAVIGLFLGFAMCAFIGVWLDWRAEVAANKMSIKRKTR